MMKKILLILFLFTLKFAAASNLVSWPPADTSLLPKEHKLNKAVFIEKYGRDDSSKALISFYFLRRHKGAGGFFTGTALTTAFGIALVPLTIKADSDNGTLLDAFNAFRVSILLFGSITILSIGAFMWLRYSRKRLLRILTGYFNGKPIPKGIARNRIFKGFLHYGKWNREIGRKMKSAEHTRKKWAHGKNGIAFN